MTGSIPSLHSYYHANSEGFSFVILGGSISKAKSNFDSGRIKAWQQGMQIASKVALKALQANKSAVDVVVEVLKTMEDDPVFNAGRGSVLNRLGNVQMDASIMEGHTLQSGGVTNLTCVKNPIEVARAIMEYNKGGAKPPLVFLSSKGGEEFAARQGCQMAGPDYLVTDFRRNQWRDLAKESEEKDTIGVVVLDKQGHIAAGTSTGGNSMTEPGRGSDSSMIGASTYANSQVGVSVSGVGEYFIRAQTASRVVLKMEFLSTGVLAACQSGMEKLGEIGGTGGVIALDKEGNIAIVHNTPGFIHSYGASDGVGGVKIFAEDPYLPLE